MSRLSRSLGWSLPLVLAACGAVGNEPIDAGVGALFDAQGARSIVNVHRVFEMQRADQAAPAAITTSSGRALILAAGSGRTDSAGRLGMSVLVDGVVVGTSLVTTNETQSSKAFVRNAILANLEPGPHTVGFEPLAGSTMGEQDFVDLTVVELGPPATVTRLLDMDDGPPPFTRSFTTGGRHGVLFTAASGWHSAALQTLGYEVLLDGERAGSLRTFSNEGASHKATVAAHLVLAPAGGNHMLELTPIAGTNVDAFDWASALWLELGSDVHVAAVLDHRAGALPVSGAFQSNGGRLLVLVAGSAWSSAGGAIEMRIELDGRPIGTSKSVTTETASHKALVPTALVANAGAGEHVLGVLAAPSTRTDFNDYFNVTVLEIGP